MVRLLLLLPLVLGPLLVQLLFRNSQPFLLLCYADKRATQQAGRGQDSAFQEETRGLWEELQAERSKGF